MTGRFLRALPLFVAVATLARAAPELLPEVLLAGFLLVATLVGPRLPVDKPTQRLASLVVVILVIAGVRAAGLPPRGVKLGAFAYGFALAPLCVAAFRMIVVKPEWGYVATAALGFVSVMACGAARMGSLYGLFVVFYLAVTLAALRDEDYARVAAAHVPRRAVLMSGLIVVIASGLAVGAALALKPLAHMMQARINRAFEKAMLSRVAFSDSMRLGKMTKLLESNRIVLRVEGKRIDRLRGAVLDHYDGMRWVRVGGGDVLSVTASRAPLTGPDVTIIKKVGDDTDRLYLPWALREIGTPTGAVRADGFGVGRAPEGGGDATVWLRVQGESRTVLPVASFGPEDVSLGRDLEVPLRSLASQWAEGATDPGDALRKIEARLRRDFSYAVVHERKRSALDPMLDFLFEHRVGHCEYFASAMVLLARSIGIPARVVTGYRVAERNPYLGHYVVREKNAHAWVEAWVPRDLSTPREPREGAWTSFDPTPLVEGLNEPGDERGLTAIGELFAAGAGRVEDWLAERTVVELSVAAVLGLLLFGVVRYWNGRKVAPSGALAPGLEFSPPTLAWVAFESHLAKAGSPRAPSEPLEVYGARLPREDLGALVLRYARARYGGVVDEALERDLRAALRGEPS